MFLTHITNNFASSEEYYLIIINAKMNCNKKRVYQKPELEDYDCEAGEEFLSLSSTGVDPVPYDGTDFTGWA